MPKGIENNSKLLKSEKTNITVTWGHNIWGKQQNSRLAKSGDIQKTSQPWWDLISSFIYLVVLEAYIYVQGCTQAQGTGESPSYLHIPV